ncbi:MAG: MOSC domain-containing protein, partial [Bacteroidota bacterium]
RFRPNIVVRGDADAWAEDQWRSIKIGNLTFRGTKPCARCQVVTINPDTAEKGHEPLKTLASYRRDGNKVLFGLNMIPESLGEISVGDAVEVS